MGWLIAIVIAYFVLRAILRGARGTPADRQPHRTSAPRRRAALPNRFVVFDLETTGLSAARDRIIEVAAIRYCAGVTRHATIRGLVKIDSKLPPHITQLTGITDAMLDAQGEPEEKVLREFVSFAGGDRLVSYNAPFDMAFLNHALARHGLSLSCESSCALQMARRAWPGRESYKLIDVASGLDTTGVHRALKDCELALVVFVAAAQELGYIE